MAVGTGYSKIATNGLVFAYDVADVINSYIGEPTTNLLPNPPINCLPTYGNGWGTYNTNQYCGNNGCAVYWTIPNIASVSNNIVTTVSSHQIRTYDVINPQTTGGGVTAGVNYFAKKISDTQFSLHAYNSSQDGSQGYINSSTGYPVVWDSIALDQRVSVNASSFPTNWWGAPHLPNSGLVKEIRPGGFTNPYSGQKTDCIRCNWIRPDGVTDGMSYGVDAVVSPNQDVALSFWGKAASPSAVGQYVNFYHYTYGIVSPTAYSMNATFGNTWQRYSYTFNTPNNNIISYWFPGSGNMSVDIANIQIEQKSHATPFTTGTRSNTQALLDISGGGNTNTLTNMSYDSNAQFYFDGTDDYTEVSSFNVGDTNEFTLEAVIKPNATSGTYSIIKKNTSNDNWPIFSMSISGNDLNGYYSSPVYGQCLEGAYTTNNPITNGNSYHVAFSKGAGGYTTMKLYINGVSVSYSNFLYGSHINAIANSTRPIHIGRDLDGPNWVSSFNGYIYITKVYNRQLSDSEILQNYNHYKTRFNLP